MDNPILTPKLLVDMFGNWNYEIDTLRSKSFVFTEIDEYGVDIPIKRVYPFSRDHLLTLVIYNKETSQISVLLKDDKNRVYPPIFVPSGEVVTLTKEYFEGLAFTTSIVVQVNGTYAKGTEIFIGVLTEYNGE